MLRKSLSYLYRKPLAILLFAPLSFQSTNAAVTKPVPGDTTIFQSSDAPATPAVDDGMPIEVGVKFRSTQKGKVNGIRFYKGANKGGKYVVHLWSSAGNRLAEAAFTGDSTTGWKEVLFDKPVAITANTTYVAAYFSGPGDYASTNPFFTKAVVNGPLRALATGEDGPNGVYKYSDAPAFPADNYGSINYWVDVLFMPDADAPVVATSTSGAAAPVKDSLPPAISGVHTTPNADGSVIVTWTTNENADAAIRYDVSPDSLTLHMDDAATATAHTLRLTKLTPGVTYYFRIVSKDAAGNTATKPTVSAPPLSFTLPEAPCAIDKAPAELNAGTPDVGTLITADGAVTLQPMVSEEFASALTTIPAGWMGARYNTDGSTVNNQGIITVSGTHVFSENSYEPGSSIEFAATFNEGSYQNIGFSINQPYQDGPWVVIGQAQPDGNLYARASNNVTVSLGNRLFGMQHRYRIKWNPTNFEFYVDGDTKPAATIALAVKSNMYIQISDYVSSDGSLSIDWMHIAPYALTGSFTSRVFDAGDMTDWGAVTWHGDLPTGTAISMAISTGNTPNPNDGSWTSFKPLNVQGESAGVNSRYIQYKATLKTTDNKVTPVLKDVAINCKGNGRMRDQVKEALKPAAGVPQPGAGLNVKVAPNPSADYFELSTTTGNNDKPLILNVLDSYGRIVEHHQNVAPNTSFQFGQSLSTGNYFLEVLQGAQRKTVKIIKIK